MTSTLKKWPIYGEQEKAALKLVLDKAQWGTLGDEAMRFAKDFSTYCNCDYGISVTSGSVALELILRSMHIGYGDEVIVPAYTFYSTMSSVAMAGATPVLADMDSETYNISPAAILEKITAKTKAIVVTHIGGRPCDMDAIGEICAKRNLMLVEDAAHAHGSEWRKRRVGSLGDAAAFSFQSSKNLTCGEGGFIATTSSEIFREAWHYHNSGRSYEGATLFGGTVLMGTNARMAEWEAAILNIQLQRLDAQIQQRMENAAYLQKCLSELECFSFLKEDERVTRNSYHLFVFKYHKEKLGGVCRNDFVRKLQEQGVPVSTGYNQIHKMKAMNSDTFRKATGNAIEYDKQSYPVSEKACLEEAMWIPGSALLGTLEEMDSLAQSFLLAADALSKARV